MKKLTLSDIKPLQEYETIRKEFRNRIIELKKNRRITLGDCIALVFENRETALLQIQEMIRTEHLYEERKIREEMETYNALIPDQGELSATLFIEITEANKIKTTLDELQGIDSGKVLYLQLDSERINGVFEAGHSKEDKLSAVHYVRFRLSPDQQAAFEKPGVEATFVVSHPRYHARAAVPDAVRSSLNDDLKLD